MVKVQTTLVASPGFEPAEILVPCLLQQAIIIESDVCDPVRARNVRRRPVQVAVPALVESQAGFSVQSA
jgi:hypothetical protein